MRDIPGCDGLYGATAEGRIWAHPRKWSNYRITRSHEGHFLSPEVGRFGYRRVTLHVLGKRRRFLVHRLVALAWLPNPNALPFVNHKDGDKANNAWTNLEWCTQGDNERHAWRTGLKKDTAQRRLQRQAVARAVNAERRKLTREQAAEVRQRRATGESWSSLSRAFNLHRNGLKAIVNGQAYTD